MCICYVYVFMYVSVPGIAWQRSSMIEARPAWKYTYHGELELPTTNGKKLVRSPSASNALSSPTRCGSELLVRRRV